MNPKARSSQSESDSADLDKKQSSSRQNCISSKKGADLKQKKCAEDVFVHSSPDQNEWLDRKKRYHDSESLDQSTSTRTSSTSRAAALALMDEVKRCALHREIARRNTIGHTTDLSQRTNSTSQTSNAGNMALAAQVQEELKQEFLMRRNSKNDLGRSHSSNPLNLESSSNKDTHDSEQDTPPLSNKTKVPSSASAISSTQFVPAVRSHSHSSILSSTTLEKIQTHKSTIAALRPMRRKIKWNTALTDACTTRNSTTKIAELSLHDLHLPPAAAAAAAAKFMAKQEEGENGKNTSKSNKSSSIKTGTKIIITGSNSASKSSSVAGHSSITNSLKAASILKSPSTASATNTTSKLSEPLQADDTVEEPKSILFDHSTSFSSTLHTAPLKASSSSLKTVTNTKATTVSPKTSLKDTPPPQQSSSKSIPENLDDPMEHPGRHLDFWESKINHCCKLIRRVQRQAAEAKEQAEKLQKENQALRRQLLVNNSNSNHSTAHSSASSTGSAARLYASAQARGTSATTANLQEKLAQLDEQIGMLKMQKRNLDADTTVLREIVNESAGSNDLAEKKFSNDIHQTERRTEKDGDSSSISSESGDQDDNNSQLRGLIMMDSAEWDLVDQPNIATEPNDESDINRVAPQTTATQSRAATRAPAHRPPRNNRGGMTPAAA